MHKFTPEITIRFQGNADIQYGLAMEEQRKKRREIAWSRREANINGSETQTLTES